MQVKSETPTDEQFNQAIYREEHTSPIAGSPKRFRRTDTTEIDRLLFASLISPSEHANLEGFRVDLGRAGLVFSSKSSMEPSSTAGSAQFIADAAFLRAKRVNEQIQELKDKLGQKNMNIILSMLTSDLRMSPGAMPIVKKAAEILEPFYT